MTTRGDTGFIYLAHPIDQAGPGTGINGRNPIEQVGEYITKQGWGTFDPGAAFTIGHRQRVSRVVQSVNNLALGRSKGMVAFLPPGVVTYGTPLEIDRAAQNGIPVAILGGLDSWAIGRYQDYEHVRVAREMEAIEDVLDWLLDQAGRSAERRPEPLPFQQLRPADGEEQAGQLPRRAYNSDCGYDLVVSQRTTVPAGKAVDVPCNLAVELPDWAWGLIVGRSSTSRVKGLQVHLGVVDSGYRGELFVQVSQLLRTSERGSPLIDQGEVVVEPGERLGQLIVMSNHSQALNPVLAGELSGSDRGVRGFGSSGR